MALANLAVSNQEPCAQARPGLLLKREVASDISGRPGSRIWLECSACGSPSSVGPAALLFILETQGVEEVLTRATTKGPCSCCGGLPMGMGLLPCNHPLELSDLAVFRRRLHEADCPRAGGAVRYMVCGWILLPL